MSLLPLRVSSAWPFVIGLALEACGGVTQARGLAPTSTPTRRTSTQPSPSLTLEEMVVTESQAESLGVLHARGLRKFEQHDFNSAAADFALCVKAAPTGNWAPSCLFHEGLARDELGQLELALDCFARLLERFASHPLSRQAMPRTMRLASHLERWDFAASIAVQVLASPELRPFERVLPYGVLAMQHIERGDDVTAEQFIARARTVIDEQRLDIPGKIHRDLATVYFAQGEVHRLRAERIRLVPLPSNFAERLEARCQLILDAQSVYSDAMRAFDAHWSTMAGYRVGELYASLHAEVMQLVAQHPVEGEERRLLLEGAMRLRYSVLVQKALRMMQQTLEVADRVGETSEWVHKARQAKEALLRTAQAEEEAIAKLPYSREALNYALERLKTEPRRGGSPP